MRSPSARRPLKAAQGPAAELFMRIALEEAARGVGRTSPNPAVGAILVRGGRILARGFHHQAGAAHAEVMALREAKERAAGADLYTTLEPCDHFGRTPPCSHAILEAGVRRVFFASSDPNPLVNGKGVARLESAGVEVHGGVLKAEADALNRPFFKFIRTGLPFVTLKAAITLDGKLATATGDSRWVTGEEARKRVHQLRDRVDAVLVGANTVRRDDPQLTTRLPGGRDAVRVVVDSGLSLPASRKVFVQSSPARTIVATLKSAPAARRARLEKQGVEVWTLPGASGRVALPALLRRMGKAGLLHVLVEGGAQVHGAFMKAGLADELALFIAPKVIGGDGLSWLAPLGVRQMGKALALGALTTEKVGEDVLLTAVLG